MTTLSSNSICCVCRIASSQVTPDEDVSFHKISLENVQWLKRIHSELSTFKLQKMDKICSQHFDRDDIVGRSRKRIRKGAQLRTVVIGPLCQASPFKVERSSTNLDKLDSCPSADFTFWDIKLENVECESVDLENETSAQTEIDQCPKRCRICLTRESLNARPFQSLTTNDQLVQIFEKITGYQIILDQGDRLPRHICEGCNSMLLASHAFLELCHRTESKLRQGNELTDKDEMSGQGDVADTVTDDMMEDVDIEKENLATLIENKVLKSVKKEKRKLDPASKQFLCPFCGKIILRLKKYHMSMCSKKPGDQAARYECHHCQRLFAQKSKLLYHIQQKHLMIDVVFKCKYCAKTFKSESIKFAHVTKVHKAKRPFNCHWCSKGFFRNEPLQDHIRLEHTKETPFTCHACGMKHSSIIYLRQHIRKVHPKKPVACDICHRIFNHQSYLTKHRYTHTGEKPYKCPVCKQGFIENRMMRKHCEKAHPDYALPPKGTILKTDYLLLMKTKAHTP